MNKKNLDFMILPHLNCFKSFTFIRQSRTTTIQEPTTAYTSNCYLEEVSLTKKRIGIFTSAQTMVMQNIQHLKQFPQRKRSDS